MQRNARRHCRRSGTTALIALCLAGLLQAQSPESITVGRATVVYWPGHEALGYTVGEIADETRDWPGIPDPPDDELRVIIAPDRHVFDSISRGRIPDWGAGAAFPGGRTILLRVTTDPFRVLRHELAHLALASVVRNPPLWFTEGYAVRAAGEWDLLFALRMNVALVTGRIPTLTQLDRVLRAGASSADIAYALAGSTMLMLERWGGDRGLEPIIAAMSEVGDVDRALREVHGVTLDQFEDQWRRDTRRRYGWFGLLGSMGVFWLLVGGALGIVWFRRRKRDRVRRKGLDQGWEVPEEEWRGHP